MGDYQRLQTEAEPEVHLHCSSANPRINKVYYVRPMTKMHKAGFASSIIFCVTVVLFFIWGLPCNVYQCTKDRTESISWDKTLTGLELKGRMHLVGGNLIAILKSARWGRAQKQFPPSGGGIIALFGKNGNEIYWVALNVMPRHIDCSTLDLVENNAKACLIVGENGYMAALNPVSGLNIWKINIKDQNIPQPQDIDVPLSIPDVDGDRHKELATLSRFGKTKHRLAVISGKTGLVLKQPLLDYNCDFVNNLTYDYNTGSLFYTCTAVDGYQSQKELSLKDLFHGIDTPSPSIGRVIIPDDEKMRFVEGNSSAGEHNVIVTNKGICPGSCFVSINVTDCQNKTIWSYHMDKAYIMYPIPLHFKHSITGFLLKLWHWHTPPQVEKDEGIRVELIKERIVLITFNKSKSIHVVNASQTDIVQLCYENECQPHLSFQTQSALIADLNGDGTQDLISYFVTYKTNNEDPLQVTKKSSIDNWVLESRVQVVQLEAELHKLYEAATRH